MLRSTIYESFKSNQEVRDELANELRRLLICPRLHTVSVQVKCSTLKNEMELHDILRAIAEVWTQFREKIGGNSNVDTNGRKKLGQRVETAALAFDSESRKYR